MKILTKPSVYVVGRQVVDNIELNRFFEDVGVTWETDTEIAAEKLVEIAGRTCYQSWVRKRPGGNLAYVNHILDVRHGCYDAETEVLTADGWKAWPDVIESDRLATIHPETKQIEYHLPIRLVSYHHVGDMYRVESQGVDLLVTPDHRMLVAITTTKAGRENPSFELISARELGTRSHRYLKCGEWGNPNPSVHAGRDVLALLGFAIGDGHIHGRNSYTVQFHLRRERKIAWLQSLCTRLNDQGFHLRENPEKDRYTVLLPDDRNVLDLFGKIYDDNREKVIPQQVLINAGRDALEGLYEGLMQSDGHVGRTCDSFDTTSPHLPGQFQQLCLHLGLAANVAYTHGPERRNSSFGEKPLTRLNVIRRCLRPEVNKWAGSDGRSFWIPEWEGDVYCAEVPNNTLYVRRNGKPVWSGNSVTEHASWNLLITGVSRSLTHELIRHRVNNFSQLSQRYVDESVAEYVEPEIIAKDPELHALWLDAVERSHLAYVALADKLTAKLTPEAFYSENESWATGITLEEMSAQLKPATRTSVRKAARQAARSVLPNATETKIFVTANARSLRHMIEQRCSRFADPEIRQLFGMIWQIMLKEAPHLFGDYVQMYLPDGSFEVTTTNTKV